MELFGMPSMSQARRAVRTGQVFVEGVKRKCSFHVSGGERIEWRQRTEAAAALDKAAVPEELREAFRVVYEDEDLAVVWKPAGVETVSSQHDSWSALRISHHFLKPSTACGCYRRARAVHRLDAATAGLVCLAKTQPAHLALGRAFAERSVRKRYLALLVGPRLEPAAGRIDTPLRCQLPGRSAVLQEAATEYEALAFTPAPAELGAGISTVRLQPLTGRTHQLRRHAARDLGRPILGDERYGGELAARAPGAEQGLCLCATELELPRPGGGPALRLEVEEPPAFEARRQAVRAALASAQKPAAAPAPGPC